VVFSSGLRYHVPSLSEEENRGLFGSDYSEKGFGYNFILETFVEGPVDDRTGMVINLKDLDRILKEVTEPMDHHFLNTDVSYFHSRVPTPENVARFCFEQIEPRMEELGLVLRRVRLHVAGEFWVDCERGE
jgi:6-pyruvoyltetrahydropterin/6-carboxytetrahydropterin synthase